MIIDFTHVNHRSKGLVLGCYFNFRSIHVSSFYQYRHGYFAMLNRGCLFGDGNDDTNIYRKLIIYNLGNSNYSIVKQMVRYY